MSAETGSDATFLRGRGSFLVAPVGIGGIRAAIFEGNITKCGGVVAKPGAPGAVAFLLAEKACEDKPAQMAKVLELWEQCGGRDRCALKTLHWMEDMLMSRRWIDEDRQTNKHRLAMERTVEVGPGASRESGAGGSEPGPSGNSPQAAAKRALSSIIVIEDEEEAQSPKRQSTSEGASAAKAAAALAGQDTHTHDSPLPVCPNYVANSKRPPPQLSGGFETALLRIVDAPDKHKNVILLQDAQCLVIYDGFPKAKYHLLVLPRQKIMSLTDLSREHVVTLRHLHRVALHVVRSIQQAADAGLGFRVGFHSVPSLQLLHLHVISADFDSPSLKNKKHWNSFQPPFFLDSQHLIQIIQRDGRVTVDKTETADWLKAPLKSHRTGEVFKNIPALKQHLAKCTDPVSSGVVY